MSRAKHDIKQHLRQGLEESDNPEVRYHLRQALQALAMLDEPGPAAGNDADFESLP